MINLAHTHAKLYEMALQSLASLLHTGARADLIAIQREQVALLRTQAQDA